jgi:hypothetical protein
VFPLLFVLHTLALQNAAPLNGAGRPEVSPPRLEQTATIDGALDEAAWAQAARLSGFSQYQPSDGRPAQERTDVLVWYGPDAIYFGIQAFDRDPSSIRATVADRDNIDRDDSVTIYLDTFDDHRRAFFFAVNPLGSQQDGVFSEGQFNAGQQHGGGNEDKSPDYRFESKGRLTSDGYTVEVRIPFKSLRYPGGAAQTWGINFKRKIQRTGYEDTWTDARRVSSFLAQAGTLVGLHDLHRGVVTEVQPFVTGASDGTLDAGGSFVRGGALGSGGVNARFGFTNVSLDATVNPDFSQVESDAGLVTINQRFALFYPEKRPFFLEGIELFSTPNQLVYTRQIVNPAAGAKVTGKFGGLGVAYMTAVDDTGGGHALFNVARVRRDLGTSSVAGVTLTDREEGATFNRVFAADARIVFAKLYYVLGQIGGSWDDAGTGTRSSPIWTAEFDRTAPHWGFNYKLNGIGESFVSRAGYVPRNNIVDGHLMNRFSYYGKPGAAVEEVTTFFGPSRIWRFADFGHDSPIEGHDSIRTTVTLRGGWELQASPTRDYFVFDPADYVGYGVAADDAARLPFILPREANNLFGASFSVKTPTWQRLNGQIEFTRGGVAIFPEASEGRQREWSATLGVRPTQSIRIDFTAVRSDITRSNDDSEFARTTLPRLKVEYQPKRSLFFRMVTEYRSQRQAALLDPDGRAIVINGAAAGPERFRGVQMNWLVSYEPTPGTAAYFGYGTSLEQPQQTFDFLRPGFRRASDAFFVKLAYLFRR